MMKNTFMQYSYSPCCGYKIKFNKFTGYHEDGSFSFTCEKCRRDWKGDSLITIEEWKNINRIDLIDKMLNVI